jgi:hypothetical protein
MGGEQVITVGRSMRVGIKQAVDGNQQPLISVGMRENTSTYTLL